MRGKECERIVGGNKKMGVIKGRNGVEMKRKLSENWETGWEQEEIARRVQ